MAKYCSPRYDLLTKWLGVTPSDNKLGVIDHWLGLIGQKTGTRLKRDDFHSVVYQMIHRAASACHKEAKEVALVYQCFGASDDAFDSYENDLRYFHRQLGHPETFQFYLHRCIVEVTDNFNIIRDRLAKHVTNRAEVIRAAILDEELFRFSKDEIIQIKEANGNCQE
jgi:hypothetical protein